MTALLLIDRRDKMSETKSRHANAVTWNRRVTQNPERYGTTQGHIRQVEKRIKDLLEADEKVLAKMRKRQMVEESGEQ